MRYIRRKDNPLIIKCFGSVDAGGLGPFDPTVYEEIENDLPTGYQIEVVKTLAQQLEDILIASMEQAEVNMPAGSIGSMMTLKAGLSELSKYVPDAIFAREATVLIQNFSPVPAAMEPVRQAMLAKLSGKTS